MTNIIHVSTITHHDRGVVSDKGSHRRIHRGTRSANLLGMYLPRTTMAIETGLQTATAAETCPSLRILWISIT